MSSQKFLTGFDIKKSNSLYSKQLYDNCMLTSCREGKDEIILVKEDQLWKEKNNSVDQISR